MKCSFQWILIFQAITLAEHDINDVDCELKLDFRVLVPNQVRAKYIFNLALITYSFHINLRLASFFTYLLTTRFPTSGLSAIHVRLNWLLDWRLVARRGRLLITYQTAAYPTHQ